MGSTVPTYRRDYAVRCPRCGGVRVLRLTGPAELALAEARPCYGCRWGRPGLLFVPAGLGRANTARRVPAEPTAAPCGSLAKMRVMRARLERGEVLFHPGDNEDSLPEVPFAGLEPWSPGDPDPLAATA